MSHPVVPIFARVLGINSKTDGGWADLEDPNTRPVLAVCFGWDGLVRTGFYIPSCDEHHEMKADEEDDSKDKLVRVPRDDPRHQACLDNITHFAADLETGGTKMAKAKIPSWLHNYRHSRPKTPTQRLYDQMGL